MLFGTVFGGDGPELRLLEEKLSWNVSDGGALFGWMRLNRQEKRIKGPQPIGQKKSWPTWYLSVSPLLPIVNSDNAMAYSTTIRLLEPVLSASSKRPKTGSDAENYVKKFQKIPHTDAVVTLEEAVRFGWSLKKIKFDVYFGAGVSADYRYGGLEKYSKRGDTITFSSEQNPIFALGTLQMSGWLRVTVPVGLKWGTLLLAPEFGYFRTIAWQGYAFVDRMVIDGKDIHFLPEEYVKINADRFSFGLSVSYEPEPKTKLFRLLSPQFGLYIRNLLYSFFPRYQWSGKGTEPRTINQRSIELGVLMHPARWCDVGFSTTVSTLIPQYRVEALITPVDILRILLIADLNRPDLFLQPQNSYRFTFVFGNDWVRAFVPISYNGRNFGVGFGMVLGWNLRNAPNIQF